MARRLRAVPAGANVPAVPLTFCGELPMTLHAAIEAVGHPLVEPGAIERLGPDHYRVTVEVAEGGGDPVAWLFLPAPALNQDGREVHIGIPGRHEVGVLQDFDLAAVLVTLGWTVTPPQPTGRTRLLWEAPGGLGDQVYVVPWAREEG